jgi:hypothetical protein
MSIITTQLEIAVNGDLDSITVLRDGHPQLVINHKLDFDERALVFHTGRQLVALRVDHLCFPVTNLRKLLTCGLEEYLRLHNAPESKYYYGNMVLRCRKGTIVDFWLGKTRMFTYYRQAHVANSIPAGKGSFRDNFVALDPNHHHIGLDRLVALAEQELDATYGNQTPLPEE